MRELTIYINELENSNYFGDTPEEIDENLPLWISAMESLATKHNINVVFSKEASLNTISIDGFDKHSGEDLYDQPESLWFDFSSYNAWEILRG